MDYSISQSRSISQKSKTIYNSRSNYCQLCRQLTTAFTTFFVTLVRHFCEIFYSRWAFVSFIHDVTITSKLSTSLCIVWSGLHLFLLISHKHYITKTAATRIFFMLPIYGFLKNMSFTPFLAYRGLRKKKKTSKQFCSNATSRQQK